MRLACCLRRRSVAIGYRGSSRVVSDADEPYPFESDDDIEIRELDLDDVDALREARITVSELAGEAESWRYGHVIVDEAQDLSPMQWRMVMRRVRGQSLTIVGDLAQRSRGGPTTGDVHTNGWSALLPEELTAVRRQDLTVNYRSPAEIHELAVAVLADFAPSIAPSRALRMSGWTPQFVRVDSVDDALDAVARELLEGVGGQVAVISADGAARGAGRGAEIAAGESMEDRVQVLSPNQSKGLEFDGVVLVEPATIWGDGTGAAELYIALTRATQRLVILHSEPLPAVLASS